MCSKMAVSVGACKVWMKNMDDGCRYLPTDDSDCAARLGTRFTTKVGCPGRNFDAMRCHAMPCGRQVQVGAGAPYGICYVGNVP